MKRCCLCEPTCVHGCGACVSEAVTVCITLRITQVGQHSKDLEALSSRAAQMQEGWERVLGSRVRHGGGAQMLLQPLAGSSLCESDARLL